MVATEANKLQQAAAEDLRIPEDVKLRSIEGRSIIQLLDFMERDYVSLWMRHGKKMDSRVEEMADPALQKAAMMKGKRNREDPMTQIDWLNLAFAPLALPSS